MSRTLRPFVGLLSALILAACSAGSNAPTSVLPAQTARITAQPDSHIGPYLVTMNYRTGALEVWPLRHGGGSHPKAISAPLGLGLTVGLASKDEDVAIVTQHPNELALYDINNQTLRTIADPFGSPTDVAIGKDGTIYVNNVPKTGTSITLYAPPQHRPVELKCGALRSSNFVAVDNENDIFIQGYGGGSSVVVAEIAAGSQTCTKLDLKQGGGYAAGIVVDPVTDDLVTLDDPDLCAGGAEGRMTVYPKPYNKATGTSRVLGFECSSGLRLSADSKYVYLGDTNLT